jgi:hypothetical protein
MLRHQMPDAPHFPSFNVLAISVDALPDASRRIRLHTKQVEPFDIVLLPKMARELSDKLRERIVSTRALIGQAKPERYTSSHSRCRALYGQILDRIKEVGPDANVAAICRKFGASPRAFYVWRHHHKNNGVQA